MNIHSSNNTTLAVKPWRKFWPPTGPNSPWAKKPASGIVPTSAENRPRVMIGPAKEARAPAIATEKERGGRGRFVHLFINLQKCVQILIGGGRVAHMKLDRLPDAHAVGDRQGAGRVVQAHDIADQKIAAAKSVLILADDAADVQAVLNQVPVARLEFLPNLLQLRQGCFAAQFQDDIFPGFGDDQRPADGAATLRNDAARLDRATHQHADSAFVA